MTCFIQSYLRGGWLVEGELVVYALFLIAAFLYGAYLSHKASKKPRRK